MVKTKRPTGRSSSIPGGLAAGGGCSLATTLILASLIANMVNKGMLDKQKIGYAVMVLLMVSSYLGAWVTQGRIKHRRLAMCILSGLVYFLMLLCITALFFGGQYTGVGATAGIVFAGAFLAGMFTLKKRGPGSTRRN